MQFKLRLICRQVSPLSMFLHGSIWERHLADKEIAVLSEFYKTKKICYEISTLYECVEKNR